MKIYYKNNYVSPRFSINDMPFREIPNKEFFDKLIKIEPDIDKWNEGLYLNHANNLLIERNIENVRIVLLDLSYRDVANYVIEKNEPKTRCNVI